MEYKYTALDFKGNSVTGQIDAENEIELFKILDSKNLILKKAYPVREGSLIKASISRKERLIFIIQISQVIKAGISLSEGLRDLTEETKNIKLKNVYGTMLKNIQGGFSFSATLRRIKNFLPESYISMIEAGETMGKLEEALDEIILLMEWEDKTYARLKKIYTSPLIILFLSMWLFVLLGFFVLPRYEIAYQRINISIPFPASLLLWMGRFILNNYYFLIGFIILIGLFYMFTLQVEKIKELKDKLKIKFPILGEINKNIIISKTSLFFGSLLSSGISVYKALGIVASVSGNKEYSKIFISAQKSVERGNSISESLKNPDYFPGIVTRMISIGEKTGNVDKMLKKVNEIYTFELENLMERTIAFLEPALIIMVGSIVLLFALSVLLPLYNVLKYIH